MPELPEVETVVRGIKPSLVGRRVEEMWHDWDKTIHSPTPDEFAARIVGQRFQNVRRRAKYIICELDNDFLVIHLKMTGRLYVVPAENDYDADKWVHFRLQLDDGTQLRFSDMRKFGKVYLTNDIKTITGKLGPEPLEDSFSLDVFQERLAGRSKMIKPLLLDQTFVAGVGNIYADESLHMAGIHPKRRSNSLTDDEVQALYGTVRAALQKGIDQEGASFSWYRKPDGEPGAMHKHFLVFRREGEPCYNCGTMVEKIRVAQRGTHFCPACQPLGS